MIWDILVAYLWIGTGYALGGAPEVYRFIDANIEKPSPIEFVLGGVFAGLIWPYAVYEDWRDA